MAYFALVKLRNTIRSLENFSRLSELPYSFDTLDFPLVEIESLKLIVEKLDGRSRNKRLKAFNDKIREAACGLEDAVESVLADLIRIAQSDQSIGTQQPSMYEEQVREGLNSFVGMVKEIEEEYKHEFEYQLPDEEEEDDDEDEEIETSRFHFCEKKPKMVGSNTEELITKIKDQLNEGYKSSELRVVSIVGVAGSGRSAFAWDIFHNQSLPGLHKLRAWVRVGHKYNFRDILVSILSQIDGKDQKSLDSEGEKNIFEYLQTILKGGDYLIVLDDVQETRVWEYFRNLFPDENNGSRVLLTTHLEEVAVFARSFSICPTFLLNSEEIWDIICRELFPNNERCPPQLEKAGRKIAKNCKGLLFEIVRIAVVLSEVDQTPENWNNIAAEMVDFAANVDGFDEIYEMSEMSKMMGDKSMSEAIGGAIFPIWKNVSIFSTHVAVTGMAGIGKTAVARKIFDDPWTLRSYEHRVWLTLGPKYQLKGIFADILAELDPNIDKMHTEAYETLIKHINSILSGKRCFIVLDDVWDEDPRPVLDYLLYNIKCEVLFTTRLWNVALDYFGSDKDKVHEMELLNDEESWSLLQERVFGEEKCPRELVKVGKVIAENCEGLPLMIVTVASLLLLSRVDEGYWNEVATNKNLVFEQAYLIISNILYPSYKNLELEHRAIFLYMAAFPVKSNVELKFLFPLYNAEGIIPSGSWTLEEYDYCLSHLFGKSLVWIHFNGRFSTFSIHSVFWHLCVREARKDNFFHVMRTVADGLSEDIEKQHRLCVQNSVLFAIKDAYNSMASVSAARSLLCSAPYHQYQVPICLESKFLKVLSAIMIRFYEFPVEISTLVLLRYLSLAYNGTLPTFISKLWNLEFLIISKHMSINIPGNLSYVPVEIWDMKELKHLQITGSNLPDPPNSSSAILDRLTELLGVRAESVTKRILERIPNLECLHIIIELAPDHASQPSFSFDHISHLKRLYYLLCFIENPELKYGPAPISVLPSCLKILILKGCGYPWEQMRPIALLPNLEELALECYAFQGAEWIMREGYFCRLGILILEDTDLVNWRADDSCHLVCLRILTIKWCFKLKEIPWQSIPRNCYKTLVDCPLAWEEMPENNSQAFCSWIEEQH